MVLLFQILSGITFINAYGTFFFSVSGISDTFLVTVISSVCQLAGLIFLYPSLRFLGRRTILLWGGAAEVVCLFLFAILGVAMPGSQVAAKCLVAFTLLYGFFFTWSWGPVGWVVASETSTNTLRSKTQSFGTAVNWTASLVVSIVIPYLINPTAANLGGKVSWNTLDDTQIPNNISLLTHLSWFQVGFIFGSLTFVGLIWTYFYLPETGGRSLEELDELFLNVCRAIKSLIMMLQSSADARYVQNVPARKFSTYQLTGQVGDRRGSVGDIHKEDVSTSHTENKV
jgi:Na+/melibiose symporter-like transporter